MAESPGKKAAEDWRIERQRGSALRRALVEVLGDSRGNAAWHACREMCGYATHGLLLAEAASAALELAATDGELLRSKPARYTARAVRNAITDDRRSDGHAICARLRREDGSREWRELVPIDVLDWEELDDRSPCTDEYPSEVTDAARLWELVTERAMARDPEAVTAWQMKMSHTSTREIARALGQSAPQGARLANRGWQAIRKAAREAA